MLIDTTGPVQKTSQSGQMHWNDEQELAQGYHLRRKTANEAEKKENCLFDYIVS